MKRLLFTMFVSVLVFTSCREDSFMERYEDVCEYNSQIQAPPGYSVQLISEIEFNGGVESFQFVNNLVGFAMLGKVAGYYVEVFKTMDGGVNWSNLSVGINRLPRYMAFKNEDVGIISVFDQTGCPSPNCLNRCIILKTIDGGTSWEEKILDGFSGVLFHPQFDELGDLYAYVKYEAQDAIVKSTDEGESWELVYTSTEMGFNLTTFSFKVHDDRLYISTSSGNLQVVNKEGDFIKTIETGGAGIVDVEILDDSNLIMVHAGGMQKTQDGGENWQSIQEKGSRIIGFDSIEKGLALLYKSACPIDVYQVNDVISTTKDGGLSWLENDETTTNLRIDFKNSQQMSQGRWLMMIDKLLIEIREL